ncbi:MAG: enoyl-CoA hydratase/isomerase family protein, partial [Mesorhizobium sp.]
MAERLVTFEKDGTIGVVTLRRPEKFNALDIPMLRALETALDEAEAADDVRVVLIRGQGKGFCAGGDVEAWAQLSAADFQVQWVR